MLLAALAAEVVLITGDGADLADPDQLLEALRKSVA